MGYSSDRFLNPVFLLSMVIICLLYDLKFLFHSLTVSQKSFDRMCSHMAHLLRSLQAMAVRMDQLHDKVDAVAGMFPMG